MSDTSDNRLRHDDSGSDHFDETRDLHPAIDPEAVAHEPAHLEPPPVDVDAREGDSHHLDTPDVIELGDPEEALEAPEPWHDESGADVESPDFPASTPIADPDDYESIPPPNVPPGDGTFRDADAPADVEAPTAAPDDDGPAIAPEDNDGGPGVGERAREAGSKATAMLGGATSRLGRIFEPKDEPEAGSGPHVAPGVSLSEVRTRDSFRGFLDPHLHVPDLIPHRRFTGAAAGVALLLLLANEVGPALVVASLIVPVLLLMTLVQHDLFEKESNLLVGGVCAGGVLLGLVLSGLTAWIHGEQWFDRGVLNYGAAGYGGRFADAAGSAPFIVWLLVGLVLPAIAIAGIAGIPIAMRRWPQFSNEITDGLILAGAAAAGYAIGSSTIYWWPLVNGDGPQLDVSTWTIKILGVALIRPIAITLCGALVGAGIWRYMMVPARSTALLPAIAGAVAFLLLALGSIQLQPWGNWPELLWSALIATAVFILYRTVLGDAVETDRQALEGDGQRVVCPSCRQVTPMGAFCARCGQPLVAEQRTPSPA